MKYSVFSFLGAALIATPGLAGFEVESATSASQEVELELINTVRVGGVAVGDSVSEHEIAWKYGALTNWQVGIAFEIANERGANVGAEGFEIFTKTTFWGGEFAGEENFLDMAVYTAFEFNFTDDDERTFVVGPILGFNFDPFQVTTNGFFEVPLADDAENTDFTYAVGAMYDVNDSVAIGFEAHGEVPDIVAGAPPLGSMEHFIGPAVELSFEPEPEREVGLRVGSFFGLTSATPTVGLSANLELGF